ncbi:MAG: TAT-variant-translocated molybdopterin oxidoreductase [Verrucomicrobia bacterium]|nr:TAT-variant-translocated molybdopterin oxidoreductase [Kiritimatiellia bacterium]MCO6399872.1 TAT-variant-translocated molybdopterin oxidoreductase [Verrucomicrobiota bacterium]
MNENPHNNATEPELTLAEARAQLAKARGRHYWRSLEQLASSGRFHAMMQREMPQQAIAVSEWDPIDRRDFIRLMGASLALAGLTACTKQHEEKIVPYVSAPEDIIPGKPLFYATAISHAGYGYGVLAESHMGRPTKIEGNPDHPASLGSADAIIQASILQMYDPDRSQAHTKLGRSATWNEFARDIEAALTPLSGGAGFHILTETVTSPTLASQLRAILEKYPQARWHQYAPINQDNALEGAKLALGAPASVLYSFDKAAVVLSLDADFLSHGPGHMRYARDFMARHTPELGEKMSRLYAVESSPNLTGAQADHKLSVRASQVEAIARALARGLGLNVALGDTTGLDGWISAVLRDLKRHRGEAIVIAGDHQPPIVHALAHAMNDALDNHGKTVELIEPVEAEPINQVDSIKELAAAMNAGSVKVLLMIGANPAYNAPADCGFSAALAKVPLTIHHGLFLDETAKLSHWHLAATHYLEEWGDVRAYDGTASIVQPLIEPLYGGRSAYELLSTVLGRSSRKGLEIVQEYWKEASAAGDAFDSQWRHWLRDGVIPATASGVKKAVAKAGFAAEAPAAGSAEFEFIFQPDYGVWDGCYANNGWLQEMPRPLTQVVWDNVVLVAPQTAASAGIKQGAIVRLRVGAREVEAPAHIQPGHPEGAATVYLGGGRTSAGRTGDGTGFNAYAIRASDQPWIAVGTLSTTGASTDVVTAQEHHSLEGRHLYRIATLEDFIKDPKWVQAYDEFGQDPASIYPGFDYSKGNQWGMVINLNACIGCNACVVACQAENNIPVVGKDQVRRGREMHWIRVDRYFSGDPANPSTALQPVTCMHCENAPCEAVCPVAATTHSADGINQMVYNRCVGTRYCSNNCPYKVRRFNFYKFADHTTPSLKLQRNPDVTVRSRGVMEKCTYCIQRISAVRIAAKKQGRLVNVKQDGLQTACQQACPTRAIVFGDINNPEDDVAKLRASPLSYGMLIELNTRPRTTYLGRIRNPNRELEGSSGAPKHGEHV